MPEETLDLRNLKCPMPALLTRRALAHAKTGTELDVVADDPMAAVDIPHMCHQEKHEVVSVTREGDVTRFRIRKTT